MKLARLTSKKTLPTAEILIRACALSASGRKTTCEPSFGVDGVTSFPNVRPPSVDIVMRTFAVPTGGALVPATDQVTVSGVPASTVLALACDVTRNGPAVGVSVSVVSSCATPPAAGWPSRAVRRKCSAPAYAAAGRNSE